MEIRYYGDKITHHIAKTPEGFLICQDVPISRTGYQTYLSSEMFDSPTNGHRAIPVYRPAEEVFDVRSLASFEGKPVTNEHPDEDVTPENYSRYSCGHVQNVHVGTGADSNKVLADLYITDPHLIDLIQHGKREISCGYYAEERRDAAGRICQTRIRGNHVAVVRNGRAGKNVCIRDQNPFDRRHKDFGVKGMKKGVRKAVNAISSVGNRVANAATKRANKVLNTTEGKVANAMFGLKSKAKRAKFTLTKTPFGFGLSKVAGSAIGAAKKVRNSPAGRLAFGAGKIAGRGVAKLFGKKDSNDMIRRKRNDFGVKGMKKGVHKAIEAVSNSGVGRVAGKVVNSLPARAVRKVAKTYANAVAGSVKKRVGKPLARIAKGNFNAAKRGRFGLAPMAAARIGEKISKKIAARRREKTGDSLYYNRHFIGDIMRRRRNLYDEEPFIDDDVMLDEDYLADDDYLMDDEFVDSDEFVDDDELMQDDEFADDDYLEDDDEFADDDYLEDDDEFTDDDYLEDDDEFADDDYLEDDDEFADDDYLEDDDEFMDDDEFADGCTEDDDEFADGCTEDDDFSDDDEISASAKEVIADAADLLRAARRKYKLGRRKDAIILNDDDLEDDDEGVIQTDADLEDDDYLADDDFLSDDDFEDDDEFADADDFEDDDELTSDDEVEVTETSEDNVIDEDKARALREITEASRGISDPNERKQLQDAIYKALCKKTQMPGLMKLTKKNVKNRMDSANANKNKVNVADQQSIYDSFNPHKKTSF